VVKIETYSIADNLHVINNSLPFISYSFVAAVEFCEQCCYECQLEEC